MTAVGGVGGRTRTGISRATIPLLMKTGFVLVVLLAWQVGASLGGYGAIPTPVDVAGALVGLFGTGAVWAPLGITLAAWAISFALSAVIGVALGFLLGWSRIAYRVSAFVVDFCRTIPALGMVPLAALLFGSKMTGTVFLAVFGAVWAVLIQTIYGVRDVDPIARHAFRANRARRVDVVFRLVLPTAAPYIATGLRLAAAVALLLTLSAEIIIPSPGIGQEISQTAIGGAIPKMYAYIVLSGLLGIGINAAFVAAERSALAWHPSNRKAQR